MPTFHYSDSTTELKLKINNRVVVLSDYNAVIPNNCVTISQTTSAKLPNYPSLFKYGFRVVKLHNYD